MEVDSTSTEFQKLCKNFRSDWATGKGPCPDVNRGVILRVVNPAVSASFEQYRKELPVFRRNCKQYYHGSRLDCKIYDYSGLCSSDSCGICGITRQGFDPNRISRTAYGKDLGQGSILQLTLQRHTITWFAIKILNKSSVEFFSAM